MTITLTNDTIAAVNDRNEAIRLIQNGWTLFSVPQMFGIEEGVTTFCRDVADLNHAANTMSKADASRVLQDFETASRDWYRQLPSC